MSKHTPGPWGFEKTMLHSDHEAENIFANDGAEYLGAVWKGENAVPNARLMAAAPDMLEALKFALQSDSFAFLKLDARIEIREAIAKAEG